MNKIDHDFNNLKYSIYKDRKEIFKEIKKMMIDLKIGETYYHFVSHQDNMWNKLNKIKGIK